jgi:hypothetical protein
MHRLIMEISEQELERVGIRSKKTLEKFDSLEVIHYLRNDKETSAMICKVTPKNQSISEREMGEGFDKFEVLSRAKDGLIAYIEVPSQALLFGEQGSPKVYISLPIELREGKVKFTLLGSEAEITKALKLAKRRGLEFKILSSMNAKFAPSSPLRFLTRQQHAVLVAAYRFGYLEVPRKITTQQLAQKLGVVKSTLSEQLRKAQNRLLTELLKEA